MFYVITAYLFAFTLLSILMLHSIYSFNKTKKELKALEHTSKTSKEVAK